MHNPRQPAPLAVPSATAATNIPPNQIKQESCESVADHARAAAVGAASTSTLPVPNTLPSTLSATSAVAVGATATRTNSGAGGSTATSSSADLMLIRNSLKTVLIQPKAEDVLANSKIKPPTSAPTNYWCMIYYYELNERVGEVFKSEWKPEQPENPQLIIDGGVRASTENTRFCLGVIGNINRNAIVTKVSRSIGKGIRLYQRDENIFLECLSDTAIFVQCPLFARKNNDELATVYKLKGSESSGGAASPANNSEPICLFDIKLFEELLREASTHGYNALYMLQVYCLCRISFVKGWGQQYRRQTIISCPMWIEVQFPRSLQMLDEVMMEHADEIGAEEMHSFS